MAQGDLVTLARLKAHLGVQSTSDDLLLSSLIGQISRAICSWLNRPFLWPRDVTDVFDGNGRDSIQLRHWPVLAVTSVSVDGRRLPPSTSPETSGWLLESGDDEPPGAMQRLLLRGACFPRGWQNIAIAYRAGYQIVDEACVAPDCAPFRVVAAQPYGAYACDCGASYAAGGDLVPVAANPGRGQYVVDGQGGYQFSPQDAGAALLLNYGYAPHDLAQAAMEWAADRYRHRERIAMTSKSLGGQETAGFQISAMPEFVALTLRNFARVIAN